MATFTAVKDGDLDGADTWDLSPAVPGEFDDVDCDGFDLGQGAVAKIASLTDSSVGNTATLTLTGSFECHDVSEVPIIVPDTVTATIDFGDEDTDAGCSYSGAGNAIECQTGGTVTDVTGKLTLNGGGYGLLNGGTWQQFSGRLVVTSGYGAINYAAWTDFRGTVIHADPSSDAVANAAGTWSDFSGLLVNQDAGRAAANDDTWTAFTGVLLNLGAGISFEGVIGGVTGAAGNKQGIITTRPTDCEATNIVKGKTILGITGTLDPTQGVVINAFPVNTNNVGPHKVRYDESDNVVGIGPWPVLTI